MQVNVYTVIQNTLCVRFNMSDIQLHMLSCSKEFSIVHITLSSPNVTYVFFLKIPFDLRTSIHIA